MKKGFALGGAGPMWLALGWGILVLVGACTMLGLMDIRTGPFGGKPRFHDVGAKLLSKSGVCEGKPDEESRTEIK